jgi:tetratricopeptide (TPR) repeat protein
VTQKFMLAGALLAALIPNPANAQQQAPSERGQLDANVSLFTVMTAINAAGFDADLDSPSNHPLRQKIRDYVAKKNPPSVAELKKFYSGHPNIGFSQYISYALVLDGPPSFHYINTMKELPPDALAAGALSQILERFWQEAELEGIWKEIQPAFEQIFAQYQEPVAQELLRANALLRNPTSGYIGRRFLIYFDIMGPPNQVQTRSYGDDYFIVITPTPKIPIEDIRHAYLFYVLDPLSLKYSTNIAVKRDLGKYAQIAPALDEYYKLDFYLLTTACLVKAIETRLSADSPEKKMAGIDQALREGFILTPAFYEQLPVYEKQERSMRIYYPDLIASIDLQAEEKRLAQVKWADRRTSRVVRAASEAPKPKLSGAAKTLDDAENLYWQKQYDQSREKYNAVLRETESQPVQARAYYGLARIAAVNREFEVSEKLFEKALEMSPETETRAWALVYLGRLSFTGGAPEEAVHYFKQALAIEGAPANARKAAEDGLREVAAKEKKQQ